MRPAVRVPEGGLSRLTGTLRNSNERFGRSRAWRITDSSGSGSIGRGSKRVSRSARSRTGRPANSRSAAGLTNRTRSSRSQTRTASGMASKTARNSGEGLSLVGCRAAAERARTWRRGATRVAGDGRWIIREAGFFLSTFLDHDRPHGVAGGVDWGRNRLRAHRKVVRPNRGRSAQPWLVLAARPLRALGQERCIGKTVERFYFDAARGHGLRRPRRYDMEAGPLTRTRRPPAPPARIGWAAV
jgi:hypothetical protein